MLQKLKQKINFKKWFKIRVFSAFAVLASAAVILVTPIFVSADASCGQGNSGQNVQTCDFSQISLTSAVNINGQPGNFVRASQDGSFTFDLIVSLSNPSSLTFNKDLVGAPSSVAQSLLKTTFTFVSVGATALPLNTGTMCGTQNTANAAEQSLGDGYTFAQCSNSVFDQTSPNFGLKTFTSGSQLYDFKYTVSAADYAKLGITQVNNGTDNTSGVNQFNVVPSIGFAGLVPLSGGKTGSPFFNSYVPNGSATGAGKSIYVQLYPTQAALAAAASQPTPPSVPGYGSVTGNSSNLTASNSNALLNFINETISFLLALIQELIYAIFSYLVAPLIEALLQVHPYLDSFVAVIYPGWVVVRNVCNIFFVLALIIIAMATLFRVESYQYRHLLVQLIIAALLINFSLVIGQAVLALADTVQVQFLGNNITQIRTLAGNLMLNSNSSIINLFNSAATGNNTAATNANAGAVNQTIFTGLIQSIFWLALSLGTFCVFAAICIFLFIRIIALWILLLISPIAYAVGVLPATAHYRSEWWQNFLKYAFFTPIMAFFLNMTAIMANNAKNNPVFAQILNGSSTLTAGQTGIAPSLASFLVSVGSNILILVFLIASLKVADLAGIYGAKGVTDLAQKGVFAPFGAAAFGLKRGAGYAGRKWNDFTSNTVRGHAPEVSKTRSALFAILNPVAAAKGWQKHSEEITHASQAKAEAAGLEVAEQRLTGGKKVIPRVLAHEKEEEDKWAKAYSNMSRELVVQTLRKVSQMKNDDQGLAAKRAIVKVAMARGFIDDAVQDGTDQDSKEGKILAEKMSHNHQFRIKGVNETGWQEDWDEVPVMEWSPAQNKMVEKVDATTGNVVKKKVLKYNDTTRRAMYEALFTAPNGHMDVAALRLITDEGEEEGKKTGHFEYLKDAWFNFETGQYEWRPERGQYSGSQFAKTEMSKMQSRPQAGAAHHSFLSLSNEGEIDEEPFRIFATAAGENPSFMQERTAHQALSRSNNVKFRVETDGGGKEVKVPELQESDVRRIEKMMNISPEAVAAMYLRITKQGSTPIDVKNFLRNHPNFQIDVGGQLRTVNLTDKHVVVSGNQAQVENKWDGK